MSFRFVLRPSSAQFRLPFLPHIKLTKSKYSVLPSTNSGLSRQINATKRVRTARSSIFGNARRTTTSTSGSSSHEKAQFEAAQKFDKEQLKKVRKLGFLLGFFFGAIPTGFLLWYFITKLRNAQSSKRSDVTNTSSGSSESLGIKSAECQKGPSKRSQFNFFSDVVEQVTPGVVYLQVSGIQRVAFGYAMTMSNGSGFIVREDGLIMTNAHVVGGQLDQKIKVRLHDQRTLSGKVIALDRNSDLALVKIDNVKSLPALNFGDSSDMKAGELVIAVGSPFGEGLSNTVTTGVISNTKRMLSQLAQELKNKIEYLQTDAAIHQGNSGGPLLNLDGEVIGVTAMQVTSGISFAIPSNHAKEFMEKHAGDAIKQSKDKSSSWFGRGSELIKGKRPRYLGVSMLELDENVARELQFRNPNFPDVSSGVLIHQVVLNSPAHRSGVEPGDVVIEVNGISIKTASDLLAIVNKSDSTELTVLRYSKKLRLKIDY